MISDISVGDWITVALRYIHAVAAIAWIGGSIFHAVILRPLTIAEPEKMAQAMSIISPAYREIIDIAVVTLISSGIILTFSRIQTDQATIQWAILLAIKIALAIWMFYIVWQRRRSTAQQTTHRTFASRLLGYNAALALGLIILLIANILQQLAEKSIN